MDNVQVAPMCIAEPLEQWLLSPRSNQNGLRASLIRANACQFASRYTISSDSFLGQGTFGCVHRCTDNLSHTARAVKRISIPQDGKQQKALITEVNVLVALDHPHIVRLIEYFREGNELFMVMELLNGPTLGQEIHRLGAFNETLAARCLRHMLKALFCCHCCGIAHKDVSNENFQFQSSLPSSSLRMVDFGLSLDERATQEEIDFNTKGDIWNAGIILFHMLTGCEVFPTVGSLSPLDRIKSQLTCATDPAYIPSRLQSLEEFPNAKGLLEGMLVHSSDGRLDAREALLHPFITNFYIDGNQQHATNGAFTLTRYLEALRTFHNATRLMQLALLVAAHLLTNNSDIVNSINWLFRYLVRDGLRVDANTMRERLIESGIQIPEDFATMFRSADVSARGSIAYVEFVASAIIVEPTLFCNERMLLAIFRFLDAEDVKRITDSSLRLNFDLQMCTECAMIQEACGTDSMDYETFKTMMIPDDFDELATDLSAKASWSDLPDPDMSRDLGNTAITRRYSEGALSNPVKSKPSVSFAICQQPGFYSRVLRPYYEAQYVSNVLVGIVTGTSSYAVNCARLGLAEVIPIEDGGGAFFMMLNPKYHWSPCDVNVSTDPKLRLVGWWIHPNFVHELQAWFNTVNRQANLDVSSINPVAGVGGPGDFTFSDRAKPSNYLHTYRDLVGPAHANMLADLSTGTGQFLEKILGNALSSARISAGFHFPVRVQYSTLHLQVRVNSGDVCGGCENRGVDFFHLQSRLKTDPYVLSRDDEVLRFEATSNLRAALLAASKLADACVEEVGPHSLILS